jgi:hypothetical protein
MSGSGSEHVQEEDLKLLVRGRLPDDKTGVVWAHVSECELCNRNLDRAVEITRQLAALGQELSAHGTEKRREPRFPANEVASMQMYNPLILDRSKIQVVNVSKNGLMLRTSEFVQVGIVVQIRLKARFVVGEVRYCLPVGDLFQVGIQIQNSQRRRVVDVPDSRS